MGMYTELYFNSQLKPEIPDSVIDVLKYMFDGSDSDECPALPDHELFKTARWHFMSQSDSYYFDADTHCSIRYDDIAKSYYLCVQTNLKNYDCEIQKFLDWINPYLYKEDGEFLGFYRYEEDDVPTLVYYRRQGM